MNTTDKDIQVLEVFVSNNRYILKSSPDSHKAQEVRAASNILSDFRDMREMVEEAWQIQLDDDVFLQRSRDGWRVFRGQVAYGGASVTATHPTALAALDAWRDGVKGEK